MTIKGLKHYLSNPKRIFSFLASRGMLRFLPDERFLKISYKLKTGKKLNLENPKTFNEKLQWIKLNCRDPLMTQLVDKYEVRSYIKDKLGEEYLVPLAGGPWENVDDIDIESLETPFILKCTHNSGGVCFCRNKDGFDIEAAKKKLKKPLSRQFFNLGREWPYKNVKPRIIAEKFLDDFEEGEEGFGGGLTDYKFYMFGGEPKFLTMGKGLDKHNAKRISFMDLEGNKMPFGRTDYKEYDELPQLPESMPRLLETAKKLAKDIPAPFVRIDLYSVKEKIYFSEITFFPCGGTMPITPPEWDGILGSWINIEKK